MTVRVANVKGIKFLEEPNGADKGGVALITFDLFSAAYTASADTIKIGGTGSHENGVATTATLATMIQNRRRDGKTVTLTGVGGPVMPGIQAAATNGPLLYTELAALADTNTNIDSIKLFSAVLGGGSECTVAASSWEQAAGIAVTYQAV